MIYRMLSFTMTMKWSSNVCFKAIISKRYICPTAYNLFT